MKLLPDGTIEKEVDGTVYLKKGEKVPFTCPGCSSFFPFSTEEVVICPKCGERGNVEHFSQGGFQYQPLN